MKPIRLIATFVFLLASAVSATVFQPTSDRQLADRSDAVVVATVRDAAARVRSDGYVVTDYRFDVEETLKGAAAGTITVSEIGGAAGQRFTFISDSAAYTPGERVMVFLRKRSDGTYFTTSMAMGKFSFTRNARGEAVVTRDVSELARRSGATGGYFQTFRQRKDRGEVHDNADADRDSASSDHDRGSLRLRFGRLRYTGLLSRPRSKAVKRAAASRSSRVVASAASTDPVASQTPQRPGRATPTPASFSRTRAHPHRPRRTQTTSIASFTSATQGRTLASATER